MRDVPTIASMHEKPCTGADQLALEAGSSIPTFASGETLKEREANLLSQESA